MIITKKEKKKGWVIVEGAVIHLQFLLQSCAAETGNKPSSRRHFSLVHLVQTAVCLYFFAGHTRQLSQLRGLNAVHVLHTNTWSTLKFAWFAGPSVLKSSRGAEAGVFSLSPVLKCSRAAVGRLKQSPPSLLSVL